MLVKEVTGQQWLIESIKPLLHKSILTCHVSCHSHKSSTLENVHGQLSRMLFCFLKSYIFKIVSWSYLIISQYISTNKSKANLRDLTAVTGLVILFQADPNCWFFGLCDLEIWWTTSKNNWEPLPCPKKLCLSFHNHPWIQIGYIVRKCSSWRQIVNSLACVTLEFDRLPWKTIENVFHAAPGSYVCHFIAFH